MCGMRQSRIGNPCSSRIAASVVMGTMGRTGIAGLLVGNTAESILKRVACSVLTVKPEGFVPPVSLTGSPEMRAQ